MVIPACNEAGSLAQVLGAIPAKLAQRVIVSDNGSTDNTVAVATMLGAEVVQEQRRGYGYAVWAGVQRVIDCSDIIVMFDGGYKEDPAEMPCVLAPLLRDEADFVLGSRVRLAAPSALSLPQRVGNGLTAQIMRYLYGVRVTDLAPFRAIRSSLLKRLDMCERTYGWPTEMIVKAALCRARIAEVDVHYRPRYTGKSKVSGSLKGSLKAGVVIVRTSVKYRQWQSSV